MAIIDKIQLSGTVYTIGNETTTAVTSASTDNEIPTAKAVYDAIPKGGGGKAIEAGRGISITTGETADTVSFNIPISAGTGTNALIYNSTINAASGNYSHAEGEYTTASGYYAHAEGYIARAEGYASHAEGESTKSKGYSSHAEGTETEANGDYSHSEGHYTRTTNESEHSSGRYNNSVSASTTWGYSGNTLFSVGNGKSNSARHNAFEIRQNGDIYIVDTNDASTTNYYEKPMIKLQNALGGGGGKAIEAGKNISITTGETADTINCTLNASNGSGNHSFVVGRTNFANKWCSYAEGEQNLSGGKCSHAEGSFTYANTDYSHTEGYQTNANNMYEHASGVYNVSNSASTTFGDSRNTLFSVGNGTSESARHNAFEIRQNGDIYITKDGQDVKLQDQLGGGGSSYTAGTGINITNNVISVTGKVDTSAITTSISSSSTNSQVPSAKAVYDQLDGLKLKKITQSAYDALSPNYDANTLYVING